MKILLFDPYGGKFTQDMQDYWTKEGHEVTFQRYYNPTMIAENDVIWFDTCDNNLMSAMSPSESLQADWLKDGIIESDMHKMDLTGKKIIVRPIDIEVWQGQHANEKLWDLVDDVIFLAPHIQEIFNADSRTQGHKFKQHIIPCGVDLDRWTFKEREKGYNIGVVAERWVSKGVDYVIQISIKLKDVDPRYRIYWLGKNNDYHWEAEYLHDIIQHNGLPIVLEEEFVDDLDNWWENKNYVLHGSHKETYTYAVAEAMAKGIKPILHRYYGAGKTWPGLTWTSIDEAVNLITEDKYDSKSYRQYLIDHQLTLPQMMEAFNAIITA